jgi:DNA ligase 1
MKPMLSHVYAPHRIIYPVFVQPKLNGIRALYQAGHFQSRDELPWNNGVLRHLTEPLKDILAEHVILDGELYVHGWPLQRINAAIAVNRYEPTPDSPLIEFHVFDVVDFTKPFKDRIDPVTQVLRDTQHQHKARIVPTRKVFDEAQANDQYAYWVNEKFEGMMYRLGNCQYTRPNAGRGISDKNNRTWHLLKRKDFRDDEFLIIDVEEGLGKRSNMVGAFVCVAKNGKRFRVGSGLTDSEATYFFQHPPIKSFAKIKYLTLTSDGIPFNPIILAVL